MNNTSDGNEIEITSAVVCVKDADGKVPIYLNVKCPSSPKPGDVFRYHEVDYVVDTVKLVEGKEYAVQGHRK